MKPFRQSPNPAPDRPSDELVWEALRYYLQELDSQQHQEFQARLENDPLAQQALVEAVYLCQATQAAAAPWATVRTGASASVGASTWAAWATAAAVLCGALLLGGWLLGWGSSGSNSATGDDPSGTEALAQAWARLPVPKELAEPETDPDPALQEEHWEEVPAWETDSDLPETLPDATTVPQWLLAAVNLAEENEIMETHMVP